MQARCLRWAPVVLAAAYLLPLDVRPLTTPDEARYAEISREMVASGDWIVPHFLGLRYFEKPVLGYWINSLSELLFGHTNFAVRLPSALSALLTAALVGWFSGRVSGDGSGRHAATSIYLSFLIVFAVGTTSVLDNVLTLCMTAAMIAFHEVVRARSTRDRLPPLLLFGACCGLGFLTKGGVALAIPVVAIVPFMLWNGRWRDLLAWGCVAVAAAAVVALPWALTIAHKEGDFWHYFFWEQHVRRFAGGDAQHPQPLWFFVPVAIIGAMPWTFALPQAMRALRARQHGTDLVRYLVLWIVMPFLFFSIARGKLATYILPCFAPAAVLLALGLAAEATSPRSSRPLRAAIVSNLIAAGALVAGVVAIATRSEGARVFAASEWYQPMLLMLALLAWGATAWFSRGRSLSANICNLSLMLVPLMLALPFCHPASGAWGRAPGPFITARAPLVESGTLVVADDVGLAGALGWYLSRSDIILYDAGGELDYGLSYPEAAARRVTGSEFGAWLARERGRHDVALFRSSDAPDSLPQADVVVQEHGYLFMLYRGRR